MKSCLKAVRHWSCYCVKSLSFLPACLALYPCLLSKVHEVHHTSPFQLCFSFCCLLTFSLLLAPVLTDKADTASILEKSLQSLNLQVSPHFFLPWTAGYKAGWRCNDAYAHMCKDDGDLERLRHTSTVSLVHACMHAVRQLERGTGKQPLKRQVFLEGTKTGPPPTRLYVSLRKDLDSRLWNPAHRTSTPCNFETTSIRFLRLSGIEEHMRNCRCRPLEALGFGHVPSSLASSSKINGTSGPIDLLFVALGRPSRRWLVGSANQRQAWLDSLGR